MTPSRPSRFRKCCAVALSATLTLQPLVGYAAPITNSVLAEVPLQGLNPVKPNIMFTLDDSGSMNFEFLPDYTAEGSPPGSPQFYCRDSALNQRYCGGITPAQAPGGPWNLTLADPPIRSSGFNGMYYDPTATYNPGKNADGTNLPCEGGNSLCTGPWTAVYQNGYAGYPGTNSGGTINLTNAYPDTAWCNSRANTSLSADIATAFGDGSKCRLNGVAYAASTSPLGPSDWTVPSVATGYNYPNAINVSTGSATTCASANEYCVYNVPVAVSGNPYYYTISSVQFCQNKDAAGFGSTSCTSLWDGTNNKFVRYGTDATKGFDPTAFTRVDIKPTTTTYPSGRTYAQEMANFAKWYTFYRTRILAMKTAGGIAFSPLSEDDARVGFHTFFENSTLFLNVTPFNATNKSTWFTKFYAVAPSGGTPTPDALWRIGEYFSNSGKSGLPGAVDPADPLTGRCQPDIHMLATDGYWNVVLGSGDVGDQDRTVPTLPAPVKGLAPGAAFPPPYNEGPVASNNSLADLAMKYWATDIRPDLPDNLADSVAPWQHVTLYGLAIGARGNIPYPSGRAGLIAGTTTWPTPPSGTPGQSLGSSAGPEAIDDLWHAAFNSRGDYFNAQNPQQLAESIVAILDAATDQSGTGTAVGIAGAQFSTTKTYGYRTSYESTWWGDIKKYTLDPNTGALPVNSSGNPLTAPLWSAVTSTDPQFAGTGWDTNRRILTINDSTNTVVPFRLSLLSTAQQASLNAGWSIVTPTPSAQSVLDYIRGDNSNEGVGTTNFRVRTHVLGDIVYSGAVPVGSPGQPYSDSGNPGYSAFVAAQQSRTPMLYVGGNDGMLHAFDDSTTSNAGKEVWAYVPKVLFSGGNPNDTSHTPSADFQIGALSYRRGGIPLFAHRFFVNATPRIWDVDFANTDTRTPPQSNNDWHTILVGGLGAGGRSIYALDVTSPPTATDTEDTIATSKRVLWEFTDPNLGYVFDAPTLVKTYRYGWVVLVVSGYNNPTGKGALYVLNPKTGALLKKLSLPAALDPGSDATPTGLSTIRAFAPSRKDPYMLQAYGGDLFGNVWRFDLSDPDDSKWKVERFAKLTDGANAQPITTGVRIEIDQNNFIDRYIFVGTGKLLGPSDIGDHSVRNSLYVIRDGTVTVPDPAPATPYGRTDLNTVDGSTVSGFTGTPTGRGWYQDAADTTQKIGTDVFADLNTVVFAFSKPSTDACARPLSSTLYARDLLTGNSVLQSEGGTVVSGIDIGPGIAGVALIQGQGGSSNVASSGDVRAQVTTMAGQVFSFGVNIAATANLRHRLSWRLINRD